MNLLVVDIDSLRADRVDRRAPDGPLMPTLAGLARSGASFSESFSQSGWTVPALASLMSGRYPADPGQQHGSLRWVPAGAHTLPEILGLYDYQVAVAWPETVHWTKKVVLFEGFPPPAVADARRWILEEAEEPFFLLAHDTDLHAVLPDWATRGRPPWAPDLGACPFMAKIEALPACLAAAGVADVPGRVAAEYDARARVADTHLAGLLDALERRGLTERTLVVVTSNHGEDLGEHGLYLHNQLYDDILRVPLVIRDPRLPPHPPAGATVQTIDVVPTILDLLGVPGDHGMSGTSLVPLLTDPAASLPERDVFSISDRMTASVRTRVAKLVTFGDAFPHVWAGGTWYRGPRERHALYLLAEDPGETRDALPERPDLVERLLPTLEAWRQSVRVEIADPAPVDGPLRDALRDDGYWAHVGPTEPGPPHPPPPPGGSGPD